MEVSLRRLQLGPDGISEYLDSELSADAITIGSAADQHVQLLGKAVQRAHAVIRGGSITAKGRAVLAVNGRQTRSKRLVPGDVIQIARHRITVTPPPPGFGLALTVDPDTEIKKSEFENAFRTEVSQTWLSKRRFAWGALLLTPLIVFLLPYVTTMGHRAGATLPAWLPDDQMMWNPGPLTPAHQQASARRCDACHKSFFSTVRDGECHECHKNISDHVTPAHLAMTTLGPAARCGKCHQEHNAPRGTLVYRSNSLCIDCHANPEPRFGRLQVDAVSGFNPYAHPIYKATVLRPKPVPVTQLADLTERETPPEGAEALIWQPVRVPVATGVETSNLKFSHQQHLDAAQVRRPNSSAPLQCGDCHVLTPDGTAFEPITMARVCSNCHELTFDVRNPKRQLVHGKPRDTILLIQDYYAHKYLEPGSVPDETPSQYRRIPDPVLSEDQNCRGGSPADRGTCWAELEIMNQFTRRGCVSCHVVKDAGKGTVLAERFTVRPVRLVSDYLPGVHFSHRTHAVQKKLTGQEACLSCHAAKQSRDTERLMIPDRDKCLECHGETPARDRVQLQCISCHAYHADHSERPSQQT